MNGDADSSAALQQRVREAAARGEALRVTGGGTKDFYGRRTAGEPLAVGGHRGILEYEPTELVITARAGTPLAEIEAALAGQHQMLAFEPPHYGPGATLGGAIACGLSGPRRPYAGAVRDFVLGVKILTGRGEILHFGGQVMKNVAGYDLSRLMAGAMGTLGILLEVSLKVLPQPDEEITLARQSTEGEAIELMNRWAAQPLPLSAACYDGEVLHLRLSGTANGVRAARAQIGGEPVADSAEFWARLREQRHGFFTGDAPLWRVCVPPGAPPLPLAGKWLLDWGGAQRWLRGEDPPERIRRSAEQARGHALLFRGGDRDSEVFHPLPAPLLALHRRLKAAFDPQRILNPGRMYRDL